jgi:hypothetical protein
LKKGSGNEFELYDINYLFNFFEDEKPNVTFKEDINKHHVPDYSLKQITGSNNHQNQLISLFDDDQRVNKDIFHFWRNS